MSSNIVIKSTANDQIINDEIKNNTPYNYQDYMCAFQNACYEIPPEYFGMLYTMSSDFSFRKNMCESSTRDAGAEAGIYIKRNDWLDPTKENVCGIFDLNGNRLLTEKGDKRQFPSKLLCDIYNTPRPDPTNPNNLIVSKLVPQDIINPVTDYNKLEITDDNKSTEVKTNYMISMITLAIMVYSFYVFRFQVNRPYEFHDVIKKLFINRVIWVIVLFGLFIYIFCPYGTCYNQSFAPLIIKNPASESYNMLCENLKNFRGKRNYETMQLCDYIIDIYGNAINTCNSLLDTINSGRNTYYNIYKDIQGCYGCLVPNPCVKRNSHHMVNFVKSNDENKSKQCKLCNQILCSGNKCYPTKSGIYDDICPNNFIIEHKMEVFDYKKDKIIMKCTFCDQTCEVLS
jgi:hypothetical protein